MSVRSTIPVNSFALEVAAQNRLCAAQRRARLRKERKAKILAAFTRAINA